MYAGFPPILTLTPSSEMGNAPFKIEWFQLSVTGERFVPTIVTQELVTPPARKLAPFSTPDIAGAGGVAVTPVGMRPILPAVSINHIAPSGPAAMESGPKPR